MSRDKLYGDYPYVPADDDGDDDCDNDNCVIHHPNSDDDDDSDGHYTRDDLAAAYESGYEDGYSDGYVSGVHDATTRDRQEPKPAKQRTIKRRAKRPRAGW